MTCLYQCAGSEYHRAHEHHQDDVAVADQLLHAEEVLNCIAFAVSILFSSVSLLSEKKFFQSHLRQYWVRESEVYG